ncbi:MAG: sensor histidine kinase [Desulfomonilaceae bacterium]
MMFIRKSENKPRPINLNDQIRQLEKMLARTIPQTITIRTILDPGILLTNADPTQIDQVIMNLTVNAKDAMGDEGKLILKTENVTLDQEFCNTHVGVKPGSYVRLTFSDSGSGISQETLSHIFEPFFTTKSVGKGTGLGLSTVYSIVKQHHGSIDCESKIGHGTTFKIYLPALAPTLNEI